MNLFNYILKEYPNNPDNEDNMFNMWLIIRSYTTESKRDKWRQTPFHILFDIVSYLLYNIHDSEKLFICHLCEIFKRDKCGNDVHMLYKNLANYTDGYIPTKLTLNLSIPISKFAFVCEVDEEGRVSRLKLPIYLYAMGTTNDFHKAYFRDSTELERMYDYSEIDEIMYNNMLRLMRQIIMNHLYDTFGVASSINFGSQFEQNYTIVHSDTNSSTIHSNLNISVAHLADLDGDKMNLDDRKINFFTASSQKLHNRNKKSNFKRQNAIVKRRYPNKNIKGHYRNR